MGKALIMPALMALALVSWAKPVSSEAADHLPRVGHPRTKKKNFAS